VADSVEKADPSSGSGENAPFLERIQFLEEASQSLSPELFLVESHDEIFADGFESGDTSAWSSTAL